MAPVVPEGMLALESEPVDPRLGAARQKGRLPRGAMVLTARQVRNRRRRRWLLRAIALCLLLIAVD